uniref:Retinol dehydrogenase 1 n=1 Tax=Paramormyrops kingsleyae TaxID=1676925 RepID=A0A3B3Q9J5_9TELE
MCVCVCVCLCSNPVLLCILATFAVVTLAWYIRDSLKVDSITEKFVLVTGCDSGFGNLLAHQLDQKGFHVIATCLTEKGCMDLKAETSWRLKAVLLNVTDSSSIDSTVQFVHNETGSCGLWGLVNNAGRSIPVGPSEWMQMEDFRNILNVNLFGLIELTLKLLPLLKKARGRVVNVSSVMGRLVLTGGGYCVSKWAVESFSDSLRRDMRHFGVKVSIIEPGFFKTAVTNVNLIDADLRRLWDQLHIDVKETYGEKYLQNYMKAQSFAMSLLCSKDISKVTHCMEHALTARHPRSRYTAGWDARLIWLPISYLPSFMADFIVCALFPVPKEDRVACLNQVDVTNP